MAPQRVWAGLSRLFCGSTSIVLAWGVGRRDVLGATYVGSASRQARAIRRYTYVMSVLCFVLWPYVCIPVLQCH